eukprot:CAMPEP_0183391360 /NCGR_PEP_ID=MMETSP0370-20130417/6376_1 /TAXON_ID=268820 /ORGANISM="Peridinium aciculiferum, Strain PAER-2" /LENGTH=248 /DNA_ID=CAMNT_0025571065 /DNA_START=53 /DNA_END=796 /DNA_ORIENTATION=-
MVAAGGLRRALGGCRPALLRRCSAPSASALPTSRAVAHSTLLAARGSRQPALQCGASSRRGLSASATASGSAACSGVAVHASAASAATPAASAAAAPASVCEPRDAGISSVSMETTPNPKAMKFIPEGREVLGEKARALVYRDIYEAGDSPLAVVLLKIGGVREVMLAADHITVTKATMVEWEAIQEKIEATILDFYLSGQRPVNADVDVQRVRPETFEAGSIVARIVELLDERVRPFVEQDGGDIEF